MNRTQWMTWLALLMLTAAASGCCCSHTNNCSGAGCGWNGWGNARIAPPATNSYQTASQPYYNNPNVSSGTVAPTSGTFNSSTNLPATTGSSLPAFQPGWRAADGNPGSGFYGPTQPIGTGVNTASFQPQANDYQSTTIDERFDPTRMPANDASQVRAPTNFNPTGNWQMLNPNGGALSSAGQFEYRTSPQITGSAVAAYSQAPAVGYPTYTPPAQLPPLVLAQGSTSPELLARDPNYQAGWRDRYPSGTNVNR